MALQRRNTIEFVIGTLNNPINKCQSGIHCTRTNWCFLIINRALPFIIAFTMHNSRINVRIRVHRLQLYNMKCEPFGKEALTTHSSLTRHNSMIHRSGMGNLNILSQMGVQDATKTG